MIWNEEDRYSFVERIVDEMIAELTFEDMRQVCWDNLYEDLIDDHWSDLLMYAEQYAPDLLEQK